MTVIRRKEQSVEYPSSNYGSDTDSLNATTSDNETFGGEVMFRFQSSAQMTRIGSLTDDCLCRKRYLGRKKRQRIANNGLILQTVTEDEEANSSIAQLLNGFKTPFERLMENETALRFWNEFIELPEEEQNLIINPNKEFIVPSTSQQNNPLMRISSKVKRALKIKRNIPFDVLQDIEKKLLNHFERSHVDMYNVCPKTSFERLMLHAIAQYHYLRSLSVYGTWPPCIQVFANANTWRPVDVLFYDVVKHLWKSL